MSGFSKRTHKGKEVIYLKYEGLSEDEIINALQEAEKAVIKDNKSFLTLTNFTGAFATKKVMVQAFEMANNTQHLARKGAIVGAEGAKSIMLKGFNRDISTAGLKSFESEEEALDFLVKD